MNLSNVTRGFRCLKVHFFGDLAKFAGMAADMAGMEEGFYGSSLLRELAGAWAASAVRLE